MLIETAKLNGVDPQAWLTDTLDRISDHKTRASTSSCLGVTLNMVERNWHRRPTVGRHNRTPTLRLKAEQIFWQPIALLHSIA